MVLDSVESGSQSMQSPKSAKLELGRADSKTYGLDDTIGHGRKSESLTALASYLPSYGRTDMGTLTEKQMKFIQEWHRSFATSQRGSSPANESVNALATLVQSAPQPIRDFLNIEYRPLRSAADKKQPSSPTRVLEHETHDLSHTTYTLTEANRHLPPQTLTLVERYVTSCRRRRAQKDGRRSVNEGPLICTYGCGYRTKRAFDWKRHEETHEPQELWLCHLCRQNDEPNPFLVNRKDKLLRHVKDAHKKWEPETVLDMSKVDFQADFEPRCHLCSEVLKTWDDRCRHVMGHYEEGIRRDSRHIRVRSKGGERKRDRFDSGGAHSYIRHPFSGSVGEEGALRRVTTDDDDETI